jgi:hypothetical protein
VQGEGACAACLTPTPRVSCTQAVSTLFSSEHRAAPPTTLYDTYPF